MSSVGYDRRDVPKSPMAKTKPTSESEAASPHEARDVTIITITNAEDLDPIQSAAKSSSSELFRSLSTLQDGGEGDLLKAGEHRMSAEARAG